MTIDALAETIAERAGRQFDTATRKAVEGWIIYHRADLLGKLLTRSPQLAGNYARFIILDLEEIGQDECAALTGCVCEDAKRTVKKVPLPIKYQTNPFLFVGSAGGAVAYDITWSGAEQFLCEGIYTGKKTRYAYINDRIYIFNNLNDEKLRIEAPWADPRTLEEYTCSPTENVPCYSKQDDILVDETLISEIVRTILIMELGIRPEKEKIQPKVDHAI